MCLALNAELLDFYMTGHPEEEFDIQEYIGLKDKKDRDIYEGVTVKWSGSRGLRVLIGTVIFVYGSLRFETPDVE